MIFSDYKETAKTRGAMAFELFVVHSTIVDGAKLPALLPDHLAYQKKLEVEGALVLAGPLSDTEGHEVTGGMIVLRAEDMAAARALAEADPMHAGGARRFEIRRWLVNEGGFTLRVGFAGGVATLL